MKLTDQVKKEIDSMSPHQIYTMFRFHPTNMTSGESGKYMQDTIRERLQTQGNGNAIDKRGKRSHKNSFSGDKDSHDKREAGDAVSISPDTGRKYHR